MFVNIGAYVGDETLIDSHALVDQRRRSQPRAPERLRQSAACSSRSVRSGDYRRRRWWRTAACSEGDREAPRVSGGGHHPDAVDATLRSAQRPHHRAEEVSR
jgi:hypothetical protein